MNENNNSSSETGGISANETWSNGSPDSTIESWSDRSPDNTIDSEDSMVPISFESWNFQAEKRLSDPSLWGKRVATDNIVYSRPRHLHLIGEPMPQGKKLIDKLFKEKTFSDMKIYCEGKVFECHRCILGAQSDVFRMKLLKKDVIKSGEVFVTESADTMEAILHFMYYDELRPWHTISGDLLLAADKYNIPDLVRICVDGLSQRIDRKNAVEILVWAYLTSQEKMFRLASKYIFERRTNGETLHTKAWEDFKERRPTLAFEIMNEAMFPAVPEGKPCHKYCTKFHATLP